MSAVSVLDPDWLLQGLHVQVMAVPPSASGGTCSLLVGSGVRQIGQQPKRIGVAGASKCAVTGGRWLASSRPTTSSVSCGPRRRIECTAARPWSGLDRRPRMS
jgi:hypothetical protein